MIGCADVGPAKSPGGRKQICGLAYDSTDAYTQPTSPFAGLNLNTICTDIIGNVHLAYRSSGRSGPCNGSRLVWFERA